MADPVVHLTNGVPDSGTGNVTTLGQTLVDGANATLGANADAVVAAGAAGSIGAKLRAISRDIVANIVLAAGTNLIGKFSTDQTTHGTSDLVAADITKVAGSAISQGHGTAAAAIRVELPTDGTGLVAANLQLAGTAVTGGAGATAAGTPRITLASDSPGIITTGSQAVPSSSYISSVVAGDIAAAATDSGNPVKIGGVASSATPTKVTTGQRVAAWFGLRGELVAVGATRENKGQQKTTITTSTSETTIVTAVASTFLDLYGLVLANSSATATVVTIKDSTGGTTRFTIVVPAGETRGFMLPADSAAPQATVNTAWTATSSQSITSLEVTALYAKNI